MEVEEIVVGCVRKGCTGDKTAPAPKGLPKAEPTRGSENKPSETG